MPSQALSSLRRTDTILFRCPLYDVSVPSQALSSLRPAGLFQAPQSTVEFQCLHRLCLLCDCSHRGPKRPKTCPKGTFWPFSSRFWPIFTPFRALGPNSSIDQPPENGGDARFSARFHPPNCVLTPFRASAGRQSFRLDRWRPPRMANRPCIWPLWDLRTA